MLKNFTINYGQNNTPLQPCFKLAKLLDIDNNIYFKREDYNPTGSYKDRCFGNWIKKILLKKTKNNNFVIHSSGNAAISAAVCCIITGQPLKIFISEKIEKKKLLRLKNLIKGNLKIGKWPFKSLAVNLQKHEFKEIQDKLKIVQQKHIDQIFKKLNKIKIIKCKNPKKQAILEAKKNNAYNLRGSTDDLALLGYKTIAFELIEQSKNLNFDLGDASIFFPASSGTGVAGVYQGFKKYLKTKKNVNVNKEYPQLNICQTNNSHSLISNKQIDKNFYPKDKNIVKAISDNIGFRKFQIQDILKKTKGYGIILNNNEIRNASFLLNKFGIKTGIETGLALAGLIKAKRLNYKLKSNIIILSTGK